ncbi:MAG: bifunctional diguanylate cyclase/phosphodiesterase, partial [Sphingomonadaceae bacterium]
MRSDPVPGGKFWPIIPALVTLGALMAVLVVNIATIVAVVDSRATEREQSLLLAAIELRLAGLEGLVDDNSFRDDAALAMRAPVLDHDFLDRTWGHGSDTSAVYSGAFVADASGRALAGYIRGRKLGPEELSGLSDDMPSLKNRLGTGRATLSGLILFQGIPLLVASGDFAPTTEGLLAEEAPLRSLILSRRFDDAFVAELTQSLNLAGLHLGRAGPGEVEMAVRADDGSLVTYLAWQPSRPGLAAVREQAATVAITVLLSLLVIGIVGRSSLDAARRLASAALSDALSGLPNRRAFRAHVGRLLLSNQPICVALLDLDGFKSVNDIYGHAVGDQLLLAAASDLLAIVGDAAKVARLGGDEFAIAAAGADAGARVERLVDAFIGRTREPFRVEERTLQVGASAGLALGSIAEADAGELLRRADVALYAAKRNGKGRSRWYHGDLDRRQAQAHAVAESLRRGLAEAAFHVVYQPIVSDRQATIAGVEALLRYDPPDGEPIAPGEFIPIAEETGLIDRIGMFALRRACEEIRDLEGLHLAVNLSAAQLRNPDLPQQIADVLAQTGFPAGRLELEVTETYLVSDPELARRTLERIAALGVMLCLDDFGTGYASLGFLRQYPFERLKIDRTLVVQAAEDAAAEAMLHASIALARVLGMTVVA